MSIPAPRISPPIVPLSPIPAYGGMRGLIDVASALAVRSIDAVFAVVVNCSGAARRARGAMALFDADGIRAGSLGGGGLETLLLQGARDVLASGLAGSLHIDAHDDSSHASSTPADAHGSMQILLLPMPARGAPVRDAMIAACGQCAWLRLRLDLGRHESTRTTPDNTRYGAVAAPGKSADSIRRAHSVVIDSGSTANVVIAQGESQWRLGNLTADALDTSGLGFGEARTGSDSFTFDNHGAACAGPLNFIRHVSLSFAPPPRIALLGAGPESSALARLAHLLGWYVEVVDERSVYGPCVEIGGVDRLHAIAPEALPALLAERHFDAAIVGGHDFDIDVRHLHHLGAVGIGYIGLLGPPERRDALLARLGDIIATQLEPRLYAPAGLRLGGEGPEASALAIVAQLQYYLAHDVHA